MSIQLLSGAAGLSAGQDSAARENVTDAPSSLKELVEDGERLLLGAVAEHGRQLGAHRHGAWSEEESAATQREGLDEVVSATLTEAQRRDAQTRRWGQDPSEAQGRLGGGSRGEELVERGHDCDGG